jgi:hypothetical protein
MEANDTTKRNRLIDMLPRTRIDHRVEFTVLLKILKEGWPGPGMTRLQRQRNLRLTRDAILRLLHHAEVLNDLRFWSDVEIPDDMRSRVARPNRRTLAETITEARAALRTKDLTEDDLRSAMVVVEEVFRSLSSLYTIGHFELDDPDEEDGGEDNEAETEFLIERNMCAAILPPAIRLLNRLRDAG